MAAQAKTITTNRQDSNSADMLALDDLLDDLLGEEPPVPAKERTPDPLDNLLVEIVPPIPAPAPPLAGAIEELASEHAGAMPPASPSNPEGSVPEGRDADSPAPTAIAAPVPVPLSVPVSVLVNGKRHVPLLMGLAGLLIASNGLSYWLGTLRQTIVAAPIVHVAKPEGIARYIGEGLDFRIDGKTLLEDEEFRTAVDELVGGPELQARLRAMLERVRATGPISRAGARIRVSACNPQSCAQENMALVYDTANKRVSACLTQPYIDPATGSATKASSWLTDELGSREVAACEGFPHPPPSAPSIATTTEPGRGDQSGAAAVAERIHARLASREPENTPEN